MEKIGLKAIFETDEFRRGQQIYSSGLQQANKAAQQAASQSRQSSQSMASSWQAGFGQIAAAAAAAYAAYKSVSKVLEMTQEAAAARDIEQSFMILAARHGVMADELIANMDKVARGTIDDVELMKVSNRAMLAGGKQFAEALPQLMEIARSASLATGKDFEYVFDTLITGIAKSSPLLIDNAEIYVKVGQAVEEVAKKSGRAADELSPMERQMATLNAVLEQGAEYTETLGDNLEGQTEPLKAVGAEWKNLRVEIGEGFLPLVQDVSGGLVDMMENIGDWVEAMRKLIAMAHAGWTAVDTFGESIAGTKKGLAGLEDWNAEGVLSPMEQLKAWGAVITGNFEGNEAAARGYDKAVAAMSDTMSRYEKRAVDASKVPPIGAMPTAEPPDYTKAAEAMTKQFDKLQDLQRDYYRNLARLEADQNRERAKAERDYLKSVEKERAAGAKRLADTTEKYEKQQARTVQDYQKSVAAAEKQAVDQRIQAERNYALQEKQAKERDNLNRIQSERRFQYEKAKAIAEGDTLAIEELNAQYAMEQQEAQENEALRRQQAGESQEEQIRQAGETAQEQLDELRTQLDETLAEQEEAYREQITDQQQANAERMAEMALNYQEQQAMREEQNALAYQQAQENHRRQLDDLGANLADQEELQKVGADKVSTLLAQYYGEDGLADQIMQGWHDRENERIAVTAEMLAGMAAVPEIAPPIGGYATGYGVGMDTGGIVQGPAVVKVGAGVVEAFTPLARGGTMHHTFDDLHANVHGLESATPADVNAIGRALAETLTAQVRTRRRN